MTSPFPGAVTASDVTALYQSLLTARRQAQTVQDIERVHRLTPLAELVDLSLRGALHAAEPPPQEQP